MHQSTQRNTFSLIPYLYAAIWTAFSIFSNITYIQIGVNVSASSKVEAPASSDSLTPFLCPSLSTQCAYARQTANSAAKA